jgi:oxygen-independent coproporphyrinogen-3 oxidase
MFEEYAIDQDDFAGVGSGAFRCVGDQMYSMTFSLDHYCRRLEGGHSGIAQRRTLGRKKRMRCDCLLRPCSGALRREDIATPHGRRVLAADYSRARGNAAPRRHAP